MVALGRVVVDHVQDDLETGGVKRLHHRLELVHLAAAGARSSCTRRGGPGSRCCCNPSSCAAPFRARWASWTNWWTGSSSTAVTPRSVRYPVIGRVGQARRRCPEFLGDVRVPLGQALYMRFVDDRLVQGDARRACPRPSRSRGSVTTHFGMDGGRVGSRWPRPGRRTCGRRPLHPNSPRRRWRWRGGPAAAWPRCSAGPRPVPKALAPGARSAGRAWYRAKGRARCGRSRSGSSTRCSSPSSSKRQISMASAISDDTAKLVPSAAGVAPSGNGRPS